MKIRGLSELVEVGVPALLILALAAGAAFAGGGVFTGSPGTSVTSPDPTAVEISASSIDTVVTSAPPSVVQVSASSTDTTVTTAEDQQIAANHVGQGNPNSQQMAANQAGQVNQNQPKTAAKPAGQVNRNQPKTAAKPARQVNPSHRQHVEPETDQGDADDSRGD